MRRAAVRMSQKRVHPRAMGELNINRDPEEKSGGSCTTLWGTLRGKVVREESKLIELDHVPEFGRRIR